MAAAKGQPLPSSSVRHSSRGEPKVNAGEVVGCVKLFELKDCEVLRPEEAEEELHGELEPLEEERRASLEDWDAEGVMGWGLAGSSLDRWAGVGEESVAENSAGEAGTGSR
jgi:hypothetical protein